MKVLTILCITGLFLKRISCQQLDIEILDDDVETLGFSEAVREGPGPCNGYPDYRNLPVSQFFYLGADVSDSNDITRKLKDGIRYLDIDLCKENDEMVVCNNNSTSWLNVLQQIFTFSKESVEQFFILNVNTQEDKKELESTINKVCKEYQSTVEGVDEFVDNECQFIYTFRPQKGPWSTMSDILNYKPDMAQWEGDGETVGIRTKFMLTASESKDILHHTAYFSPAFWRPVSLDTLKSECRVPKGGIHLKQANLDTLENDLLDPSACNLNDAPLNTFFNIISSDHHKQLPYLKELEKRMMDLNYAKWSGNYALLEESKLKPKKIQRDEL